MQAKTFLVVADLGLEGQVNASSIPLLFAFSWKGKEEVAHFWTGQAVRKCMGYNRK